MCNFFGFNVCNSIFWNPVFGLIIISFGPSNKYCKLNKIKIFLFNVPVRVMVIIGLILDLKEALFRWLDDKYKGDSAGLQAVRQCINETDEEDLTLFSKEDWQTIAQSAGIGISVFNRVVKYVGKYYNSFNCIFILTFFILIDPYQIDHNLAQYLLLSRVPNQEYEPTDPNNPTKPKRSQIDEKYQTKFPRIRFDNGGLLKETEEFLKKPGSSTFKKKLTNIKPEDPFNSEHQLQINTLNGWGKVVCESVGPDFYVLGENPNPIVEFRFSTVHPNKRPDLLFFLRNKLVAIVEIKKITLESFIDRQLFWDETQIEEWDEVWGLYQLYNDMVIQEIGFAVYSDGNFYSFVQRIQSNEGEELVFSEFFSVRDKMLFPVSYVFMKKAIDGMNQIFKTPELKVK